LHPGVFFSCCGVDASIAASCICPHSQQARNQIN